MRIIELQLRTKNLKQQFAFYSSLKLVCEWVSESRFKTQIGNTKLIFEEDFNATPYHFAINIPCNQINEAIKWLNDFNIALLPDEEGEILDFPWINARSIYFYDLDKNIVELIARDKLKNDSFGSFSFKSLLEISEIGLPNKDIKQIYTPIESTGIKLFAGNWERFAMLGDEHGMFLAINTDVKDYWIPTNDKIAHSSFTTIIKTEKGAFNMYYNGTQLTLT